MGGGYIGGLVIIMLLCMKEHNLYKVAESEHTKPRPTIKYNTDMFSGASSDLAGLRFPSEV